MRMKTKNMCIIDRGLRKRREKTYLRSFIVVCPKCGYKGPIEEFVSHFVDRDGRYFSLDIYAKCPVCGRIVDIDGEYLDPRELDC